MEDNYTPLNNSIRTADEFSTKLPVTDLNIAPQRGTDSNLHLYKICFIIANKYIKGYVSFVDYYIENINKFYKDCLILIVDNNSVYFDEFSEKIKNVINNNTVVLINNGECKFELGAYKFGMKYLIQNNLLDKYDYYICTQDTFVLKNKYDFNNLLVNDIFACPIKSHKNDNYNRHYDSYFTPYVQLILNRLNLQNSINDLRLCWANSFVIHKSKVEEFLNITNDIIITSKDQACECERIFSAILYKLNNYTPLNNSIRTAGEFSTKLPVTDLNIAPQRGTDSNLHRYKNSIVEDVYNTNEEIDPLWNIDIPNIKTDHFFTKRLTNKKENTVDIL